MADKTFHGNPNAHVTPDYPGQTLADTATPAQWQATSYANNSWVPAGDSSGAAAVVQTALTAEIARAEAAESTNATAVATETTRAEAAEALRAPLALPAADPHVLNQLWNNAGTVTISAG